MYYREGTASTPDTSDDEVVLQKKYSSAGAGAGVAAAAADGSDAGESPSADVESTNAAATAATTSNRKAKHLQRGCWQRYRGYLNTQTQPQRVLRPPPQLV